MGKSVDITGQKFGLLTAQYLLPERKRGLKVWHCLCDCGNSKDVVQSALSSGNTKSCGCLIKNKKSKPIQDLKNQKFGNWTVKELDKTKKEGHKYWICECCCGTIKSVDGNTLRNGKSTSCGCKKFSKGEEKISFILKENNIPFISQWTTHNCIFPNSKNKAKFDFFIDNKYIVEFDGKQHFEYTSLGWDNENNFKQIQYRDKIKNNWCKENKIPIIRIPYTKLNSLKLQDLQLETSLFLIKENE